MLGRGGESTYHCGNISFRQLVEDHKNTYYAAPRANKSRVVAEVVRKWRAMSPPGRFLTRTHPAWGDESPWHDVGDRRALKKASHSLRDAVRCFTQERREREKQEQEVPSSSSSAASASGSERNKATIPASGKDNRKKRTLGIVVAPERSFSNINCEYVPVGSSKMVINCNNGWQEQRPSKMRRVVCDEREDEQEDCRREGGGDGDDERSFRCASSSSNSHNGREDFSNGSGSFRMHQQTALFSTFAWNAHAEKPAPGLLSLSAAHRTVSNEGQPQQQRLNREEHCVSPCGSADWFSTQHSDLPIQVPPCKESLPPAAVLVGEVNDNEDDDHHSVGWFSDTDDVHHQVQEFLEAPLFTGNLSMTNNMNMNYPSKPIPRTIQVSEGREL
mgnify:CR=1 FL=1